MLNTPLLPVVAPAAVLPRYWRVTLFGMLMVGLGFPGGLLAAICQNSLASSQPTTSFMVAEETVTDRRTQLMWTKCPVGLSGSDCSQGSAQAMDWENAERYAHTTDIAGFTDWRLPTSEELQGLVERCRNMPSINVEVFPNTPAEKFWTSSPLPGYASYAWYIHFRGGKLDYDIRSSRGTYTRLVRSTRP